MMPLSGTIIEIGLNIDFKLSGSSVLPAYPGFMVINIPQVNLRLISQPETKKRVSKREYFHCII